MPKGGVARNITLRGERSPETEEVDGENQTIVDAELDSDEHQSLETEALDYVDKEKEEASEEIETPLELRAKDPQPEADYDDPEVAQASADEVLSGIEEKESAPARGDLSKLTDPGEHQLFKPELKLVAAMHGNEASSQITAVAFITDLVTNYESDPEVKSFVDSNRIHVLSTMNPDGHEIATLEILNDGPHKQDAQTGGFGRDNNDRVDLNRNFPFPQQGRAPLPARETELVMNWSEKMNFVLSLNLHNGGLLANYPYDDNYWSSKTSFALGRDKKGSYSKCDDDDVFRHLASAYANNHPTMANGKGCEDDAIGIEENPKTKSLYGVERFKGTPSF